MSKRIVVTGVGLISALGIGTEENWKGVLAGQSGVAHITHFDTTHYACRFAAEVKDFDPLNSSRKKN